MDDCRKEILKDVEVVDKYGCPGNMIVFGEAEAILIGDYEDDILLAVSCLDKGRVAVFTHTNYGDQIMKKNPSPFYSNLIYWLTRKTQDEVKIFNLDTTNNIPSLESYDIVVTTGNKPNVSSHDLEKYLNQGGALICAMTPWGWLQLNPDKEIEKIPFYDLMEKIGIIYKKDLLSISGDFFIPQVEKSQNSNITRALDKINSVDEFINNSKLFRSFKYLPHSEKTKWEKKLEECKGCVEEKLKSLYENTIKVKNESQRKVVDGWLAICNNSTCFNFKAPLIKEFPGDFDQCPKLEEKFLKFSSNREDFYFTGCFIPAGEKVLLEVNKIGGGEWIARIGAHSDILSDMKVRRWPKVMKKVKLKSEGTYDLSWPFGGGLYFISPNKPSEIEFKVQHIVPQPTFDSQNPQSKKDWPSNKNLLGLWADISGKYVTITMPSKSIRDLEDPTEIMDLYDQLLMCYHDLRGSNIDQHRRMWVVTDEQPSAGYMHAGYPIVTHLDVAHKGKDFLLSAENFRNGAFWGLFHEMGHNMQLPEWTFSGTGEVTVNIFSLYGMETLVKQKAWIHPWLSNHSSKAIKYLKEGANFEIWKEDPGLALFVYAQLANHFTWDAYKKVFRKYSELKPAEKPQDDQSKIDMWFIIFSEITRHNLQPLALFWGVPISSAASDKLKSFNFPAFLPDDEITRQAEERVVVIKKNYPGLSN